jgi:pimeloyl-ACP methyl ester carboxylesterase
VTAQPSDEEPKIPAPEEITLDTDDRVLLRATWFPGSLGKQSVPIILLHDGRGNRTQMTPLAKYLQLQGHAALALDVRGFGQSTSSALNPSLKIDHEKFRGPDWLGIVSQDIEAAKRFLRDRNNAGELNIEMLTIIAAGESSAAALNWAVQDWSWPDLLNRKQGKDVKALVLLSPERKWETINCTAALTHPSTGFMSFLIAVGAETRSAASEADKFYAQLEKSHPAPPDAEGDDSRKTLVQIEVPTKVQGAQLIDPRLRLGLERSIGKFIKEKLSDNAALYAWRDRSPNAP